MNSTNYCKICGFQLSEERFSICDCCGTQSGYEDLLPEKIKQLRKDWLSKGMPWFNELNRPLNWNPEQQLKKVLKE